MSVQVTFAAADCLIPPTERAFLFTALSFALVLVVCFLNALRTDAWPFTISKSFRRAPYVVTVAMVVNWYFYGVFPCYSQTFVRLNVLEIWLALAGIALIQAEHNDTLDERVENGVHKFLSLTLFTYAVVAMALTYEFATPPYDSATMQALFPIVSGFLWFAMALALGAPRDKDFRVSFEFLEWTNALFIVAFLLGFRGG